MARCHAAVPEYSYGTCTCLPKAITAALNELANAPSSPPSPPKRFAAEMKNVRHLLSSRMLQNASDECFDVIAKGCSM
jgi:hypothetical protein